ncbi:MAG TPA: MBL fold metallo-hydrolase [Nevskiaceae bacterium]|nr:MBL fold metallo-hydrolase [Nevskiaceae bacterium]
MRTLLALTLLLGASGAAAQQNFDAVQIKTTDLGQGLYVLYGAGGNIGVSAGPDGIVLIDDQFAPLAPKIRTALAAISPQPLRFVLNTHWHFDHTGGNEAFGSQGALIVAHHNVRKRMAEDRFMEAFKREVTPAPAKALPVVTFGQDVRFHLNGLELHAFHLPAAHTDGDAVVWWPAANVLHMGDLYFNGSYPVIDWGSGGRIDGVIDAVSRVLPMIDDKTRIIPGHGPLSNKSELIAYRAMLSTVAARLKALKAEGKTLEQVLAAQPTADYDATWGGGFMKPQPWVEMVWNGLR